MTDIEESLKRIYSSPGPHHPMDVAWLVALVRRFLLENDQLKSEVEAARAEAAVERVWAEEAAAAENENAEDAKKERAAVAAWLREQRAYGTDALLGRGFASVCGILADAIERGEHHRREETP